MVAQFVPPKLCEVLDEHRGFTCVSTFDGTGPGPTLKRIKRLALNGGLKDYIEREHSFCTLWRPERVILCSSTLGELIGYGRSFYQNNSDCWQAFYEVKPLYGGRQYPYAIAVWFTLDGERIA